MGFQQGLSGLDASTKALSAIGNNVANSGTVGFKASTAQFSDVYAASLAGSGAAQIGIGASVAGITQQFTQGNVTTTNNALDVAINGGGFYRMLTTSGTTSYSRNGQFQVDKNGYIINASGAQLTGYLANSNGTIVPSTPAAIQINTSDLQPVSTGNGSPATGLKVGFNLDSRLSPPSLAIATTTSGSAAAGTTITAGSNDKFVATVNGTSTSTITITSGTYSTAALLAAEVQAKINAALPSGTTVTVTADAGGVLTITPNPGGVGSGASLTNVTGNTGATSLLGASPTNPVTGSDNFDVQNPLSYNSSTSATVYDSLGNAHIMGVYFVKAATSNQWNVYTNLDSGTASLTGTLNFSSSGALTSLVPYVGGVAQTPVTTGKMQQSFSVSTGAIGSTAGTSFTFPLDISGSTQYGNIFGVNSISQDGYASGRLSGLNVSADGVVQGRYSNGQTRNLAQVVLVTFKNPNGLMSLGANQWQETATSGQPLIGAPGSGANGVLQAAAVEESNVDLTSELVSMITQQRTYQANAQTIKTMDQVLQTLVNLR